MNDRWVPGVNSRSKQAEIKRQPLSSIYPLSFDLYILYTFLPRMLSPSQSVYTDATHSHLAFPIQRGTKWLSHSLFHDMACKRRGRGQSRQTDQKAERGRLTSNHKFAHVRVFELIHILPDHASAGVAWTGLVAAASVVGAREVDLGTDIR